MGTKGLVPKIMLAPMPWPRTTCLVAEREELSENLENLGVEIGICVGVCLYVSNLFILEKLDNASGKKLLQILTPRGSHYTSYMFYMCINVRIHTLLRKLNEVYYALYLIMCFLLTN